MKNSLEIKAKVRRNVRNEYEVMLYYRVGWRCDYYSAYQRCPLIEEDIHKFFEECDLKPYSKEIVLYDYKKCRIVEAYETAHQDCVIIAGAVFKYSEEVYGFLDYICATFKSMDFEGDFYFEAANGKTKKCLTKPSNLRLLSKR